MRSWGSARKCVAGFSSEKKLPLLFSTLEFDRGLRRAKNPLPFVSIFLSSFWVRSRSSHDFKNVAVVWKSFDLFWMIAAHPTSGMQMPRMSTNRTGWNMIVYGKVLAIFVPCIVKNVKFMLGCGHGRRPTNYFYQRGLYHRQ